MLLVADRDPVAKALQRGDCRRLDLPKAQYDTVVSLDLPKAR